MHLFYKKIFLSLVPIVVWEHIVFIVFKYYCGRKPESEYFTLLLINFYHRPSCE